MAIRWSSETSNEKSFLLLASAIITPMMSASGLVMPARKRGFWLRMAARSVVPERGSPEMKWNLRAGFAPWGAAGMGGPLLGIGAVDCIREAPQPDSMSHLRRSGHAAFEGDRDAPGRNVPSAHFDDRRRCPRSGEMRGQGKRFAGPQRDVIVAPQDRQHQLAARGSLDRYVLEQRHCPGGWRYGQRYRGDV